MVRRAYLKRRALLPAGNGTLSDFGNGGVAEAVPLRSTRLAAVTEYDPATQVVGVQAGMSLAALQATLGEHGQWLPLRPPLGDHHTLGGIAALNACGPERLRYGAPRDLLLGLKFISGTGRQISAGGRVMKNVAGYDVTRLLAGSAGTLGFITELTLRISSLPECCLAVSARGSLEQCGTAAAWLLQSKLEPNFVVAVPGPLANAHVDASLRDANSAHGVSDLRWQLVAGFEGFRVTVDAQVASCRAGLAERGLNCNPPSEYPAREGICPAFFDVLYQAPYVCASICRRIRSLLSSRLSSNGCRERESWPIWGAAGLPLRCRNWTLPPGRSGAPPWRHWTGTSFWRKPRQRFVTNMKSSERPTRIGLLRTRSRRPSIRTRCWRRAVCRARYR